MNILVERIWWGVGEEKKNPSEWGDEKISFFYRDFAASSVITIFISFPKRRYVSEILFGFTREKARPYKVSVEEKILPINLREFSTYSEIEDDEKEAILKIWLDYEGKSYEGILGQIKIDKPKLFIDSQTKPVTIGLGRKKRTIAKVFFIKGSHRIQVNGQEIWEFFEPSPNKAKLFLQRLLDIEDVKNVIVKFNVQIIVDGSSPRTKQQAYAVTHALARALSALDPTLKQLLLKQYRFGGVRVHSKKRITDLIKEAMK
jgi:ribosomal protein S9